MAAKKKKQRETAGLLAENRKARYLYAIEDTLECGIVLVGTEVKSIRDRHFNFVDAHAFVKDGELWLANLSITPYEFGNIHNHQPDRLRKLLAHSEEIEKLRRKIDERGYTLVPTKFYLKNGKVKVEIGIAKGKKLHDKRESIKQRDLTRDQERRRDDY